MFSLLTTSSLWTHHVLLLLFTVCDLLRGSYFLACLVSAWVAWLFRWLISALILLSFLGCVLLFINLRKLYQGDLRCTTGNVGILGCGMVEETSVTYLLCVKNLSCRSLGRMTSYLQIRHRICIVVHVHAVLLRLK